jgi:hypothetical protein
MGWNTRYLKSKRYAAAVSLLGCQIQGATVRQGDLSGDIQAQSRSRCLPFGFRSAIEPFKDEALLLRGNGGAAVGNFYGKPIHIVFQRDGNGRSGSAGSSVDSPRLTTEIRRSGH